MKVRNAEGLLSTEVPIGRLVWVDSLNGIDQLAARGRMTLPFRTLAAAAAAAVSGDTVVVLPGYYDQTIINLAKNGVNWHFMNGVTITPNGVSASAVFDVSSSMSFNVTGHAVIQNAISGKRILNVTSGATSSIVHFSCYSMASDAEAVKIDGSSNTVLVEAESASSDNASAVYTIAGTVISRIKTLSTLFGAPALQVDGGNVKVFSDVLVGVLVKGGTTFIKASVIGSSGSHAVEYNVTTTGLLTIVDALLDCYANSSTSLFPLYITNGSNGAGMAAVRLNRCVLVNGPSGPVLYTIDSAAASQVALYGECLANKTKGGNVTIQSPPAPALTLNANLKPYDVA